MQNPLWTIRCALFTAGLAVNLLCLNPAHARESRWAATGDPTAKALIDWERQWAEAGCTHNGIEKTILAPRVITIRPIEIGRTELNSLLRRAHLSFDLGMPVPRLPTG